MKLVVGGDWNTDRGKPSSIVAKLAATLGWPCLNGGNIRNLRLLDLKSLAALVWMPNISNEEEKLLPDIKKTNPQLLLIQSKRVVEKDYTEQDIIGRLLASHSNLGIMITKPSDRLWFKLLDPLGNIWTSTDDVEVLGRAIAGRVSTLLGMKRVGSERVGEKQPFHIEPEFIQVIRTYGDQFTRFVNAVNPNRLLGNASTRCAKGFPAVRTSGAIYVTRRNVDKTTLSEDDFVQVLPRTDKVYYYGDQKPSVDSPIQLRLFDYYPRVNYMLHGHVYVKGGIKTHSKIPCGYIDEYEEIIGRVPDRQATNFVINLRGHGCLILAETLRFFIDQTLEGRPFPEGEQ